MTVKPPSEPSGRSLSHFPVATRPAGRTSYRSHSVDKDAAWRSSVATTTQHDGGRFDLTAPRGTLYTSDDVETAVRERVRDAVNERQEISAALASSFSVSVIIAAESARCADFSAKEAASYGVTRAAETTENYSVTRSWAGALDRAGFDGVRYGSRFTSGPPRAWATFGPEGACSLTLIEEIPGATACAQVGIRVLPPIQSSANVRLI